MRKCVHLLISGMLGMSLNAFATLGELSISVKKDLVKLHGTEFKVSNPDRLYRIHAYKVAPKIDIREYVSVETGKVFAVSWRGPIKPDLQQLLGQYYLVLMAELKKPHDIHMPTHIKYPYVVIESNGHPHHFWGRAYIPFAIPGGSKTLGSLYEV